MIEEYDPGRSCAPIKGLAEITSLDPTAVAATALNAMWECAGGTSDTAQRLDKIGNRLNTVMLRDEMSRHMGAKADALAKKAQKKFTSKWRQKRWLEKQAEFRGVTFKPMDKDVRIFVGTLAHNAVMQSTKLFQEQTQITKGRSRSEDNPHGLRTKTVLVLTDEAKAEVESGNARAKWMMPLFSPLVSHPCRGVTGTAVHILTRCFHGRYTWCGVQRNHRQLPSIMPSSIMRCRWWLRP